MPIGRRTVCDIQAVVRTFRARTSISGIFCPKRAKAVGMQQMKIAFMECGVNQPYNKHFIFSGLRLCGIGLARSELKNLSPIFHCTHLTRG